MGKLVIISGGGIEGDPPLPGTVRIIKTLNNDENLLLENVSFNIFKADGTPVNNGEPIITNNEGMVEVADLPAGEYYLQEISAPNHIEFDENNKIFFTIEPNSDEGLILSINNNIATTSVPVEKVWELQDKEAETVTIHLLADGEKVDTVDLSSENDWKHTFTDLPTVHDITDESAIVYTVEEVAVEGFDSEITGNAKDGYTVTNSEQIDLNDSGEGIPSKGKDKPSAGQTGEEIPSKGKDKPSTGHTGEVTPSKGNNEPSKGHSEAEASSENDHKDSLPDTGIANNTPVYLIITLMAIGMIFLLISYITRRKSSK